MLNIIVAPDTRDFVCEQSAKRVVRYLKSVKAEYSVYFSTTLDEIVSTAHELRDLNESDFVLIGDDVALSYLVNGIKDLGKIKLGIVPAGQLTDFSRFLGISSNPVQAIKDILEKNIESIDYMIVNDKIALNQVLVGASAEVYELYDQYKSKNYFTKKYVRMKYGAKFNGIELNIDFKNGKHIKDNIFELSISNGGYLDGDVLSPLSNIHDGLMNLNYCVCTDEKSKKKYFSLFKSGKHIYDENTKQHWLNSVKITNPDKKIKIYLDGRIFTEEELDIRVIESGLKLYLRKPKYVSSENKPKSETPQIESESNENKTSEDKKQKRD